MIELGTWGEAEAPKNPKLNLFHRSYCIALIISGDLQDSSPNWLLLFQASCFLLTLILMKSKCLLNPFEA